MSISVCRAVPFTLAAVNASLGPPPLPEADDVGYGADDDELRSDLAAFRAADPRRGMGEEVTVT